MAIRSKTRRETILAGALHCFTELGYDAASIACICRASNSSVGSVYHHFGDKEGVAAALYLEGIGRYQAGLNGILESDPDPSTGITRMVEYHLAWVREHPDWARFLFLAGAAPKNAVVRGSVRQGNAQLLRRLASWIDRHANAGRLVAMEPDMFLAVTLGPSHEIARRWACGKSTIDLVEVVSDLAAAARRAAGALTEEGET